jgi:hypothetical protein
MSLNDKTEELRRLVRSFAAKFHPVTLTTFFVTQQGENLNRPLARPNHAIIRKADVSVAKNYLSEEELRALNNLAEQYLIFAEGQALRRVAMSMQDWIAKLEGFLTLNDREILQGAGTVSAQLAKSQAEQEFDKFRVVDDQRFESDFDRMVKRLPTRPSGKAQE